MGIVYLFIKLYPVFGISLGVLLIDLTRSMKRRKNKAWVGLLLFAILFFASSVIWLVFRGDKNADLWFKEMQNWFQNG